MVEQPPKKRLRPTTMVVVLKDLKAPWEAWCHARGVTPSEAVRQVLRRVLESSSGSEASPHPIDIEGADSDERRRVEIRLTRAEYLALTGVADREGMSLPRWLTGLVRLHLVNEQQFGEIEVKALTRSNQVLLALGRNINQIARNLSERVETDKLTLEQIEYLTTLIKVHTAEVSAVLTANSRRWRR